GRNALLFELRAALHPDDPDDHQERSEYGGCSCIEHRINPPCWSFSAQPLDLCRETRIAGDVIGFHFRQAAVDVAEPGADFAGGAGRALAHALPILLLV